MMISTSPGLFVTLNAPLPKGLNAVAGLLLASAAVSAAPLVIAPRR